MSYVQDEDHPGAVTTGAPGRDRETRMAAAARRDRRTAGDYLDLCMKGAAELEAAVDSLSERLSTVLRPERPQPSRDLASATEDQSALSDHLDRHARGLADLAGRLRSLAERVDL